MKINTKKGDNFLFARFDISSYDIRRFLWHQSMLVHAVAAKLNKTSVAPSCM